MGGREKGLENLVRELRDIEEIKALKARYCYALDDRNWDVLYSLWTEDATAEYDPIAEGIFRGAKDIVENFLKAGAPHQSFVAHMVHNGIVEVDGDEATGEWYLTEQSTRQPGSQATWAMARYFDRFERVNGEWKFKALKAKIMFVSPYEDGWGKTPFLAGLLERKRKAAGAAADPAS